MTHLVLLCALTLVTPAPGACWSLAPANCDFICCLSGLTSPLPLCVPPEEARLQRSVTSIQHCHKRRHFSLLCMMKLWKQQSSPLKLFSFRWGRVACSGTHCLVARLHYENELPPEGPPNSRVRLCVLSDDKFALLWGLDNNSSGWWGWFGRLSSWQESSYRWHPSTS